MYITYRLQEGPYGDLVMNTYSNLWGLDHTHIWFSKSEKVIPTLFSTCHLHARPDHSHKRLNPQSYSVTQRHYITVKLFRGDCAQLKIISWLLKGTPVTRGGRWCIPNSSTCALFWAVL